MATDYSPKKRTQPTAAQKHLHALDVPHYRPDTAQELIHQIRKVNKHRQYKIIEKLKGY